MSHFLKRMDTPEGIRHLFFYTYQSFLGRQFHVSVCCPNEGPVIYEFIRRGGKWKLKEPEACPHWLLSMEEELNAAIEGES